MVLNIWYHLSGNGLIDETEFLQWISRIQALKEESSKEQNSNTSVEDVDDDLKQDLIAAFRYNKFFHKYLNYIKSF